MDAQGAEVGGGVNGAGPEADGLKDEEAPFVVFGDGGAVVL